MSRAARRKAQLERLERLADLQARAARQRLAAAQRAEAETRQSLGRLEGGRLAALAAGPADGPAGARAAAAWLRWAERERRRLLTEQAARRAETLTVRQDSARLIARHSVLERLLSREKETRR